jgi:predicted transcriptional regulator
MQMPKKVKKEPKEPIKALKETIQSIKRPLIDYINLLEDPVKYRFLKRRFKLQDDDLLTREEFEKKRKEMYGG